MNAYQKQLLLRIIESEGISYHRSDSVEVPIQCSVCSPRYDNSRKTLYLNSSTDKWVCFRCEPKRAGRDIGSFLRHVGLNRYAYQFNSDEGVVSDNSLSDLRSRLLNGVEDSIVQKTRIPLPVEYRTDFDATHIGKRVYRYLLDRIHDADCIRDLEIGYAVSGRYAGCAIFPLYMNDVQCSWQARHVVYKTKGKYEGPSAKRSGFVYGYDWLESSKVIIVEGVFDAIAMRPYGISLLGKSCSEEQMAALAGKNIRRVTVLLDGDAWESSKKLALSLRRSLWTAKRVSALRLPANLDPAQLSLATLEASVLETYRPI